MSGSHRPRKRIQVFGEVLILLLAAAMTQVMSHDGIRPNENLLDERGQAKQGLCGLDEDGIDYDAYDDMEESEKCGDSSESEVEEAENVKIHEADAKVIEEIEEPTIGEEAPVRPTRNPADPTPEERNGTMLRICRSGLGALCALLPEQR